MNESKRGWDYDYVLMCLLIKACGKMFILFLVNLHFFNVQMKLTLFLFYVIFLKFVKDF